MTAAGLTALSKAPTWVALTIALPPVLTAMARIFNEVLAGISHFRTNSMRRQQENRLLSEVTDIGLGLGYLERVQRQTPLLAPPAVEPTPASPPTANPPPDTPP
ncbi:hypothetical protein [Streptomyces sp. MK5]|uniref:hypothetical protein n=1 Tax=Streptomyces sp. MK5 TaxID=3064253 RepID=UPI0027412DC7|nr:hypothetical protein [Streptomyces sp. MK5]